MLIFLNYCRRAAGPRGGRVGGQEDPVQLQAVQAPEVRPEPQEGTVTVPASGAGPVPIPHTRGVLVGLLNI